MKAGSASLLFSILRLFSADHIVRCAAEKICNAAYALYFRLVLPFQPSVYRIFVEMRLSAKRVFREAVFSEQEIQPLAERRTAFENDIIAFVLAAEKKIRRNAEVIGNMNEHTQRRHPFSAHVTAYGRFCSAELFRQRSRIQPRGFRKFLKSFYK